MTTYKIQRLFSENKYLSDPEPYDFSEVIPEISEKWSVQISEPWKKYYPAPPHPAGVYNWAWDIRLPEAPEMHFRLEKDAPYNRWVESFAKGHSWSAHFLTGDSPTPMKSMISEDQKIRLFGAASDLLPLGEYLCTWGGLYKGAIPAFTKRFPETGHFKRVGYRSCTFKLTGEDVKIPILRKIK